MKIAFLLRRANWYRTLGPIIMAAGEYPGVEPEIAILPEGDSFKDSPTADKVPAILRGKALIRTFSSADDFGRYEAEVDAVVTVVGRRWILGKDFKKSEKAMWCAVYDNFDCAYPSSAYDDADIDFWPTPFFLDFAIKTGVGPKEEMTKRARFSGYVRLDGYKYISKPDTYAQHHIDPNRPVVLLIPDAYRFDMVRPRFMNDLYHSIWRYEALPQRILGALLKVGTIEALRWAVNRDFSSATAMREMRRFCDNNGAQLVLAPRRRKEWVSTPFTEEEAEIADAFIQSDTEFPQTLMQGIAIADLVVCSYRSAAVMEAVGAQKPFITTAMPDSACETIEKQYVKPLDSVRADFPGVAWLLPADKLAVALANKTLTDFRVEPQQWTRYAERLFGPVDGRCSERILSAIQECVLRRSMPRA